MSSDYLVAGHVNKMQYVALLMMVARHVGLKPGVFMHVVDNLHIYDRHIPLVKELISREPLPAPTFWLNPEVKDIYRFTRDDVRLDNYQTGPQITNIPIAV